MRQNVGEVYQWVVDDVVQKVEEMFAQEGVDSSVSEELRGIWFKKLNESGAMGCHGEEVESDAHDYGRPSSISAPRSSHYGPTLIPALAAPNQVMTTIPECLQQQHPHHHMQQQQQQQQQIRFAGLTASRQSLRPIHNHRTSSSTEGHHGSYALRGYMTGGATPSGYPVPWMPSSYGPVHPAAMYANLAGLRPQQMISSEAMAAVMARFGASNRQRNLNNANHRHNNANTNTNTNTNAYNPSGTISSNYLRTQTDGTESVLPTRTSAARQTMPEVGSFRLRNDNDLQFYNQPALTTASPLPVVRLSSKRKELESGERAHEISPTIKSGRLANEAMKTSRVIPQRDGGNDEAHPLATQATTSPQEKELEEDGSLSDVDDDEELVESKNCLAAQYEKVSRIKNRWRCQLRHGIFHVNGKDYLFKVASGEFTF